MQRLFILITFFVFTHTVYGCSIAQVPTEDNPVKQAFLLGKPLYSKEVSKPTYYVFIGEVVGIIRATKAEVGEKRMDAEGVKIKVTENVYLFQPASYYEVFPTHLYPDCSSQGVTGLEKVFPLGSQVRVVAFDATIYKKQSVVETTIRLETSYFNNGTIVRNDSKEAFRTSATSVFDYSGFALEKPKTTEEEKNYSLKLSLLEFELQKDLARLTQARSKVERLDLLKRLVYYPFFYGLAYKTLAHTYLRPGKELQSLEKKWEQRKQEAVVQNKQN